MNALGTIHNPYCRTGAVATVEAGDFVGREALLTRHVRHVLSCVPLFGYWGIRRIGKTSFIQELQARSRRAEPAFVNVYVDASNFVAAEGIAQFWHEVNRLIRNALSRTTAEGGRDDVGSKDEEVAVLYDLIKSAKENKRKVLLVVDEFDTCLKMPDGGSGFIKAFRAVFGGGLTGNGRGLSDSLICRVVSRRHIDHIESKTDGSTLKGLFASHICQFPVFSEDDFLAQVARMPQPLPEEEVGVLRTLSGRHPCLSAMILEEVVESQLDGASMTVREAAERIRDRLDAYFKDLCDELEEGRAWGQANPEGQLLEDYLARRGTSREVSDEGNVRSRESSASASNDAPCMTIDVKDATVMIGKSAPIKLGPSKFAILLMSLLGVEKGEWVKKLGEMCCPRRTEEWKGVGWFADMKNGDKVSAYRKKTNEGPENFKLRARSALDQAVCEIRKEFRNCLGDAWRVVPDKSLPVNYPQESITWTFGGGPCTRRIPKDIKDVEDPWFPFKFSKN